MNLHLVRHPAPILDKSYCYGSSDVAVAPETLELCCERVRAILPHGAPIYSSPLQRCSELASMLAPHIGATSIALDTALQEMHFGRWELRAWDDIPWTEVEAWNRDLLHCAPGGGETLLDVVMRVFEFFDEMRSEPAADIIIVCHGGSIRMLRACVAWAAEHGVAAVPDASAFEAIALRAAADRRDTAFGEVIVLNVDPVESVGA